MSDTECLRIGAIRSVNHKSRASFGTRLSAHYAREERRADGSDSGSGSSSSSKDLVPLSCGRGVSQPGPALTAVL